ncbi:MAG: ribosome maturation factor RimM [Lachnospiraceae bacterium]|nr:ribosome maturation factor RimM [Lachnospiraceae bacterium]
MGKEKVSELQIGVITQTHGIRGEVKVFPTTDDASRFEELPEVFLDNGKERLAMTIDGVKFFKQYVILKFHGFDSINEVEKYKGAKLFVPREKAVKLQKGEYFIADLIGMKVITEDKAPFGVLKDVLETGANDVYVVETANGKEALLPAIKECILNIDMDSEEITVHIMEGLLS